MAIERENYSRLLEAIAEDIDIPPSKYQDAVDRYKSVGRWLEGGGYPGSWSVLNVYPQGSFRLGTVTKPPPGSVNRDYDIDLVAELPIAKSQTDPKSIKAMIGNRLREHGLYVKMLDDEGRRCWTLIYSEEDGVGFHLDVLPSASDGQASQDTSIAITNKQGGAYEWLSSNPKGYGVWFDEKNRGAFERVAFDQKRAIQARAREIYSRVDDVPDQLVRTPLQRSIQLLKRHRDVMFCEPAQQGSAPISIIVTTLAAHFYRGEGDVYSALTGIVSKFRAHAALVDNAGVDHSIAPSSPIKRTSDGRWYLANPVDPLENFADRWHEDGHRRAKAFFAWVERVHADLVDPPFATTSASAIKDRLSAVLGAGGGPRFGDLLVAAPPSVEKAVRVHISQGTKPWRGE